MGVQDTLAIAVQTQHQPLARTAGSVATVKSAVSLRARTPPASSTDSEKSSPITHSLQAATEAGGVSSTEGDTAAHTLQATAIAAATLTAVGMVVLCKLQVTVIAVVITHLGGILGFGKHTGHIEGNDPLHAGRVDSDRPAEQQHHPTQQLLKGPTQEEATEALPHPPRGQFSPSDSR